MTGPAGTAYVFRAESTGGTDRMKIRLFVTGGTFDKEYNELAGSLFFKDTHLPEMLRLGRCRLDLDIRTLMMVDSLDMTQADRLIIAQNCLAAAEDRIVVTHKATNTAHEMRTPMKRGYRFFSVTARSRRSYSSRSFWCRGETS